MQKTTYFLLLTLFILTLSGCTNQTVTSPHSQSNSSKVYSLEALALRYQQRGY